VQRKSAPRVKRGRVQKRNNWEPSPSYRDGSRPLPTLDRQRPGEGFRHLLKRRDVESFIELLPDWAELAVGLNAIVLAPGGGAMGLHEPGVIHVCAWEDDLWWPDAHPDFVSDHRRIFDLLSVEVAIEGERTVVKWTEGQARAFQLLHVFLHELGHHHDRMTTRSKRRTARGESYAETYANRYFASIWDGYFRVFGRELL
jgi:hypothetical protein